MLKNNYQYILDKIVNTILENNLVGSPINEASINRLIQIREYQILMVNNWNLDVKTGYDYVKVLLKAVHMTLDFSKIHYEIDHLMSQSIEIQSTYLPAGEQIPLFMAILRLTCQNFKWMEFYEELLEVMWDSQIFVPAEAINTCFNILLKDIGKNEKVSELPIFGVNYQIDEWESPGYLTADVTPVKSFLSDNI